MEKKAYIFDLYGTLADIWTDETKPELWSAMAELYGVYGADYTPDELRSEYLRLCAESERRLGGQYPEIELSTVFASLLRRDRAVATPADECFIHMAANVFRILSRNRLREMPGAHEVLRELKHRGKRLLLLSNAQAVFTVPELEKLGLYEYFDRIFISSDHGVRKPDPRFMTNLLDVEALRAEDCVMIGNDFASDMRVAASCGVEGIFLNSDGYSEEELFRNVRRFPRGTVKVINSLIELI
ncbi:MAG: HAD family hydrolase [Oscillospiraceae bacterium]|nr:HAD family hydrolase [Oscillospiraceae bacterium]